jgi:hypothetical protein
MNHTAVVKGCDFVRKAIEYLNNQTKPIPLVLGEVGSVLGNSTDDSPLEAVLGSALWQADLFLYSMSIGVQRINLQSGLTFPFALWNPTYTVKNKTVPASVHPAFYGQIFSAEFRGASENVAVHNINLHRPFLSAYAAYDDDKLERVAIINLELAIANASRPHKTIKLDIASEAQAVIVKKLTSSEGGMAGANNITWDGMHWTAANGGQGLQVLNDTETHYVKGRKLEFNVKASEAVIAFIQY